MTPSAADQQFVDSLSADLSEDDAVLRHERVALGKLLRMPHAVDHLLTLHSEDFLLPAHQHIYGSIVANVEESVDNTAVLKEVMGIRAVMAQGDPMLYLSRLIGDGTDVVGDYSFHAARVREAAETRRIGSGLEVARRAIEIGNRASAVDALEQAIQSLRGDSARPGRVRQVDLTAYLDGTHEPQVPNCGALRDDNVSMLYPGLWHTCIAPTTSGKSWFALWHCVQEIRAGNTVVYAHFETASPAGTLRRLRLMAPDLSIDDIRARFIWLDCSRAWKASEFAAAIPKITTLVVLDGMNAACGQHGWNVNEPQAVGDYRATFVHPATRVGAAVLSLGHPVKSTERQAERHGYGATGWLDEVDGVSFRLVASKETPIGDGRVGHSTLYTVKDREAQVEKHGIYDPGSKREGWVRMGSFKVDSRPEKANTSVWLNVPQPDTEDAPSTTEDPVALLGAQIVGYLRSAGGRFESQNELEQNLRIAGVKVNRNSVGNALARLLAERTIEWPPAPARRPRPGWVAGMETPALD